MSQAISGSEGLQTDDSALSYSLKNPRTVLDRGLIIWPCAGARWRSSAVLGLYMLLVRGGACSATSVTELTPGEGMEGGGLQRAARDRGRGFS